MRTLLIDNHDSYTFNLFQLIAQVTGIEPVVLVNDDPELARLDPDAFDSVVISPGPGRPQRRGDIGYAGDFLQKTDIPVHARAALAGVPRRYDRRSSSSPARGPIMWVTRHGRRDT